MPRTTHRSLLALAVAGVLACSTFAIAATAEAAERRAKPQRSAPGGDFSRHTERRRTDTGHTRTDTWTRPDGRTATRQDVRTRTETGYKRDTTVTTPSGAVITRKATVERDREAGTRTREAVTTLPDGRTRTMSDVTTRTDDGYARDTTITRPDGSTLRREVDARYDPATKTWQRDVAVDRSPPPTPTP